MIFLEPKDNLCYSYRSWIDTEYGLLLKSVMLNSHNEMMDSIAFNQLALLTNVDLDWFQPNIDNKKSYVMENEVASIVDNSVSSDWEIKELPAGYHKVDQMIQMVHGKSLPVTHVVFSDGLASVSLFVEPVTNAAKPRSGYSIEGNHSFYSNTASDYRITVVGEVPVLTLHKIAKGFVFKKSYMLL